jgi:hypothetical protein
VIAVAPVIAALSGVGGLLRRTLLDPTLSNGLVTLGAVVLLAASISALRAFLLLRHLAPAVSNHRDRAEFG